MSIKSKRISPFWYLKKKQTKHGLRSLAYKIGITTMGKGYVAIFSPKHPFRHKAGYVLEHRLVMEKYLGRYLTKKEVVHHINEIISDNRIENLMLFNSSKAHISYHKSLSKSGAPC